jgi:hypothetical protein
MKKIIALSILVLSSMAFAQTKPNISYSMPAVEFGFKWNSIDITGASSNKQVLGFQLGASTVFDFAPSFGLKTGLFYSERPFSSDFSGIEVKGKFTYFEVPAFFMFKFEDYAGVYVGPTLAMKLNSEVNSPNTLTDVKGMIIPITLGAQFKFLPNMGVNIFFEMAGDTAKDVKNSRAVGANFMLAFD